MGLAHEGRRVISMKAYLDPDISQTSGRYISRRIAKNEFNEALRLDYGLHLLLYEMSTHTWYEWDVPLPNPTSNDPDDGEEPEAIVPRGTAEDLEPEA